MRVVAPSLIVSAVLLVASAVEGSPIVITVHTDPISGVSAQLALDVIDGGPPANTVTVSGCLTDGAVGTSVATGGVTGTLGGIVHLSDSTLFNELLTNITLNTVLLFAFDSTGNGTLSGSLPDSFSIVLLDPVTGLALFPTTDPTGSDALLQFDIGGGGLTLFGAPGGEASIRTGVATPAAVPEPTTLILVLTGVALSTRQRRFRYLRSTALSQRASR